LPTVDCRFSIAAWRLLIADCRLKIGGAQFWGLEFGFWIGGLKSVPSESQTAKSRNRREPPIFSAANFPSRDFCQGQSFSAAIFSAAKI
jgi:hypothetical protein